MGWKMYPIIARNARKRKIMIIALVQGLSQSQPVSFMPPLSMTNPLSFFDWVGTGSDKCLIFETFSFPRKNEVKFSKISVNISVFVFLCRMI
ncbi:Uncharacterized protein APZ42_000044 [Daphnia magna]|uniref:Uncharacterized protein n=1 Tax=Daphnia magna TaxID=35525 RepID=A0A164JYL3_9CRUS|nr:Uncharacterized protein APZ42_000044 [Daphnia magna]